MFSMTVLFIAGLILVSIVYLSLPSHLVDVSFTWVYPPPWDKTRSYYIPMDRKGFKIYNRKLSTNLFFPYLFVVIKSLILTIY